MRHWLIGIGGAFAIGCLACGTGLLQSDRADGWCDTTEEGDPDCILDGVCAAESQYDSGRVSATQLEQCWSSGDGSSDRCDFPSFQIDPNDPDCEECDFFPEDDACGQTASLSR